MCEARLNNGSSNHNLYTNDTRQTRSEHSNQQNIADECIPVHSGETQERAQRRHTNVRILIIFIHRFPSWSGIFFKLAQCGYTLLLTSQASYSPEYIAPTQKNHDYY